MKLAEQLRLLLRIALGSTCSRTGAAGCSTSARRNPRDRVRSYFQPSTSFDQTHQPKLKQMTLQAQSVEYILTDSPIQALIWENDLVRKEQPRFNTKQRRQALPVHPDRRPEPMAGRGSAGGSRKTAPPTRAVPARDLGP